MRTASRAAAAPTTMRRSASRSSTKGRKGEGVVERPAAPWNARLKVNRSPTYYITEGLLLLLCPAVSPERASTKERRRCATFTRWRMDYVRKGGDTARGVYDVMAKDLRARSGYSPPSQASC